MPITAKSLTPYVRTWLEHARHVRILHIFEHACNLVAENGSVVSLVTEALGNGPFAIVVPSLNFAQYLAETSPVTVRTAGVTVGPLDIDLAAAPLWNPQPDWEHLRQHAANWSDFYPVLHYVLTEHAPHGSLAQSLIRTGQQPPTIETKMLNLAELHCRGIIKGLREHDQTACLSHATQLAGLGGGLTPAGDDWLVGAVLGTLAGDWPERSRELMRQTARAAALCTTPLSAAWLNATANGACDESWHRLFVAFLQTDRATCTQAAHLIVNKGHTSGADALAGFLAVMPTS